MAISGIVPDLRVTGLKRQIVLLEHIPPLETASIHVFDISLDANREALSKLLDNPRFRISWFDHHEAGQIPTYPNLKTTIVNAKGTCTALLVHASLPGSDPRWAAIAAFGDNVPEAAEALLKPLNISDSEIAELREAGELLNYNAYGETEADVLFPPLEIAQRLSSFRDPIEFIRNGGIIPELRAQFQEDEARAKGLAPFEQRVGAVVYRLPRKPWARRLGATLANRLSLQNPECAVTVLHPLNDGAYQVSIRAPRQRNQEIPPASGLALEFPTGGGRVLAAGINHLPEARLSEFISKFFERYASA